MPIFSLLLSVAFTLRVIVAGRRIFDDRWRCLAGPQNHDNTQYRHWLHFFMTRECAARKPSVSQLSPNTRYSRRLLSQHWYIIMPLAFRCTIIDRVIILVFPASAYRRRIDIFNTKTCENYISAYARRKYIRTNDANWTEGYKAYPS